jgi:WS/DGAT/MGAT family acyltransferase
MPGRGYFTPSGQAQTIKEVIMKKLSMADNGFLQVERAATPMHVGGVTIHKLPKGVDKHAFFASLMAELEKVFVSTAPFNQKLQFPPLKVGVPSLVNEPNIDMDYHTRHCALPAPGSMAQLTALVGQLHSVLLDRDHPLWSFRLIEGLEGNRFALYFKMHHSTIDGIGAMNLMKALMSDSPQQTSLNIPQARKRTPRPAPSLGARIEKLRNQLQIGPELGGVFLDIGKQIKTPATNIVPLWYSAPPSMLNVPVQGQRRFAVKTFALEDFKAIAKARSATINDVVLATCAGALRYFLKEHNSLPERSLTCCIPVSIRSKEGASEGNAISSLIASLGTNIQDPLERLAHVHRSTKEGKAQLNKMSKPTLEAYTMMMGTPFIAGQMLNMSQAIPSPFNILISNVPASDKRLYLCGSEMEALYAVNLIFEKQALNITCTSYVDTLDFSFIACRKAFPDLEKMAGYLAASVEEMAQAAGVKLTAPKVERKKAAPRKAKAPAKAAANTAAS